MVAQQGILRRYASLLIVLLRFTDICIPIVTGYLTHVWYAGSWQISQPNLYLIVIAALASGLVFPNFSLYRVWRGQSLFAEFRLMITAWSLVFIGLITLVFLYQLSDILSRLWMGMWFVTGALSFLMLRAGLRILQGKLRQKGFNQRRVVILGAGDLGKSVAEHLKSTPWVGLKAVAFFDDNPTLRRKLINGVRVRGNLDEVKPFIERHMVDQVWIALPLRAESRIRFFINELQQYNIPIRFIPDIFGFPLLRHSIGEIAGIPIVNLNASAMFGINRLLKAVEDRVIAAIILAFIWPIMLAVAIGVKLSSPGPIMFRQRRHGWNGHPIEVWKFRTMVVHQEAEGVLTQAVVNDPRVTKIGAFLRGTSLDELPQFINVLQGRMSIVGPRPHPCQLNEEYRHLIPHYMQRHVVKPGITGWAQVNGWRGETDTLEKMKRRIEYDLYYTQNWSLWLDVKIILLTLFKGFLNEEIAGVLGVRPPQEELPKKKPVSLTVVESAPPLVEPEPVPASVLSSTEDTLSAQLKQWIALGRIADAEALLKREQSQLSTAFQHYFAGAIHGNRGESRDALKCYMKALSQLHSITNETEQRYVRIRATRAIAITKCKLGEDYQGAIELLDQLLLDESLKQDDQVQQQILTTLAAIHYFNKEYDIATEQLLYFLTKASEDSHVALSQAHLLLALCRARQHQYEDSKTSFKSSMLHFMQVPASHLSTPHFYFGWIGWVTLALELHQISSVLDECLPEFIHDFQNILDLSQALCKADATLMPPTRKALLTLQDALRDAQQKTSVRLKAL